MLYCSVLYCNIWRYSALYNTVLHGGIWCCAVQYYNIGTALSNKALHWVHYIVFRCDIPSYIMTMGTAQ